MSRTRPTSLAVSPMSVLTAVAAGVLAPLVLLPTGATAAPGDLGWKSTPTMPSSFATTPVLDPGSGDVFVATSPWGRQPDTMTRIDGRSGRVEWRVALPPGRTALTLEVDPLRGRLVSAGFDQVDDQLRGYVAVHDLEGGELWHRPDPSPAVESRVEDLAVDTATGQVCILSEEAIPGDVADPPTRVIGTSCFGPDGSQLFADHRDAQPGQGLSRLAIDPQTHQVYVTGHDDRAVHGVSTTAYAASGEVLWRRDVEKPLVVQDLLVDPRRGRVHLVGSGVRGTAAVVGYDSQGATRFRTSWRSPARVGLALEPRTSAVLDNGKVVVVAFAGSRFLVQAVKPTGGRAERSIIRGTYNNSQASVDTRRGRVLVSVNRRKMIRTTAHALGGRTLWEHRLPTRGLANVTPGAPDTRRGRFTFVLENTSKAQVVQVRS